MGDRILPCADSRGSACRTRCRGATSQGGSVQRDEEGTDIHGSRSLTTTSRAMAALSGWRSPKAFPEASHAVHEPEQTYGVQGDADPHQRSELHRHSGEIPGCPAPPPRLADEDRCGRRDHPRRAGRTRSDDRAKIVSPPPARWSPVRLPRRGWPLIRSGWRSRRYSSSSAGTSDPRRPRTPPRELLRCARTSYARLRIDASRVPPFSPDLVEGSGDQCRALWDGLRMARRTGTLVVSRLHLTSMSIRWSGVRTAPDDRPFVIEGPEGIRRSMAPSNVRFAEGRPMRRCAGRCGRRRPSRQP